MASASRPFGSFLLALLAALLILVEGVLLLLAGTLLGRLGDATLGAAVGGTGLLVAIDGFLVLLLAIGLLVQPTAHLGIGISLIVFSGLSFLGGGGFIVGGVLGVIAGILALAFDASAFEAKGPTRPPPGPDRTCGRCGRLFSGDASACPFCNAPV